MKCNAILIILVYGCCYNINLSNAEHILEPRIINGKVVKTNWKAWQFTVFFNFLQPKPLWKTCAGSLINRRWVLTAAHCVEDIYDSPKYLTIGIGRRSRIARPGRHNYTVSDIVVHPNFLLPKDRKSSKDISLDNDIALVKLSKPVPQNLQPIRFPFTYYDISNQKDTKCQAAGWGTTTVFKDSSTIKSNTYRVSKKLRSIDVKLITKEECIKLDKIDFKVTVFYGKNESLPRLICSNPALSEKQSSCIGDSGAPMICEVNGEQIIQGIVLSGDLLCRPNKGAMIFAEVSKFRQWIRKPLEKYGV